MIKGPVLLDGKPLHRVTEMIAMEVPVPANSREMWGYEAGPVYIQWRNEDGSKGCAYAKNANDNDGVHYRRATQDEVLQEFGQTLAKAFKAAV